MRPLLIVGGARGVFDDLAAFTGQNDESLYSELGKWSEKTGDVMAINDIGMYLECDIHHWASLHPPYLAHWYGLRQGHGLPPAKTMLHSIPWGDKSYAGDEHPAIDVTWRLPNANSGLSGLFAARIAVLMGYKSIILAGCPIDNSARFFDPPGKGGCHGQENIIDAWQCEIHSNTKFRERVRSLSGNTRLWLGEPEKEEQ